MALVIVLHATLYENDQVNHCIDRVLFQHKAYDNGIASPQNPNVFMLLLTHLLKIYICLNCELSYNELFVSLKSL